MKNVKAIAAAVLAVLVIIIALQNTEPVSTRILFATVEMSRALLLAVTFGAGAIGGLAVGYWMGRSRGDGDAEA